MSAVPAAVLMAVSAAAQAVPTETRPPRNFSSDESYLLGMVVVSYLKAQDVPLEPSLAERQVPEAIVQALNKTGRSCDLGSLKQGLVDTLSGGPLRLSDADVKAGLSTLMSELDIPSTTDLFGAVMRVASPERAALSEFVSKKVRPGADGVVHLTLEDAAAFKRLLDGRTIGEIKSLLGQGTPLSLVFRDTQVLSVDVVMYSKILGKTNDFVYGLSEGCLFLYVKPKDLRVVSEWNVSPEIHH